MTILFNPNWVWLNMSFLLLQHLDMKMRTKASLGLHVDLWIMTMCWLNSAYQYSLRQTAKLALWGHAFIHVKWQGEFWPHRGYISISYHHHNHPPRNWLLNAWHNLGHLFFWMRKRQVLLCPFPKGKKIRNRCQVICVKEL